VPLGAVSLSDRFEEVELDAVMGCDSAARMFELDMFVSATPADSKAAEGGWGMTPGASPEDIDFCAAFSSSSSWGEGLVVEAAALERPEASLVMATALQAEVPRRRYGWGWNGSASRR